MSEQAALHEPWTDADRQRLAYDFGIWVFLATEVMFFGGLFVGYAVCRHLHEAGFAAAGRAVNFTFGTVNTVFLMTSSLTMALAERAAAAERQTLARWMMAATLALGGAFLVAKGFEYREDFDKHLVPGPGFAIAETGAQLFFAFYWVMTGIHALHVITGLGLIGRLFVFALCRDLPRHEASVRATTLFWHLIDVIWVILYPILYLVGRS